MAVTIDRQHLPMQLRQAREALEEVFQCYARHILLCEVQNRQAITFVGELILYMREV
jgi:hypothetical protein